MKPWDSFVSRLFFITLNSTTCLWTKLTIRKSFKNVKTIFIHHFQATPVWIKRGVNGFAIQYFGQLHRFNIRALFRLWSQRDGTNTSAVQCYLCQDWNTQPRRMVAPQYMVGGFQQTCPQMEPISEQWDTCTTRQSQERSMQARARTRARTRSLSRWLITQSETKDHATTFKGNLPLNIARGTTDPGYWLELWRLKGCFAEKG